MTATLAVLAVRLAIAAALRAQTAPPIAITGMPVPGMASFDRIVSDLMARYQIPGGAVAVTRDGRLLYARGFGLADRERGEQVEPTSLFRIASLSKPITAAAILKLVEEGRLSLDDHVFCPAGTTCLLGDLRPRASADPRLYAITIRNLLQHAGGWDRDKSFDPMFIPQRAARVTGTRAPASCETVIRFMQVMPLDFDPGTRMAYSNFGYCILGRVIERVGGRSYEEYIQQNVLAPMGISDMRIGRTLAEQRAAGEVRYYALNAPSGLPSVFPDHPGIVPAPYGAFYLEAMDSHGGWIASAIDLARFITALEGRRPPAFLTPASIAMMTARPAFADAAAPAFYGMGWNVRPVRNTANWWHTGLLDGTTTIMVREGQTPFHLCWVALFNARTANADAFTGELDRALWQAVNGVTEWPSHDLFGRYP